MPYCTQCGTHVEVSASYCPSCGKALSRPAGPEAATEAVVLRYRLSLTRFVVASVLSYGVYSLYWAYLTWRQYREHTGALVYPVWHALALGIPIYGSFRVHPRLTAFKKMMEAQGLKSAISPQLGFWVTLLPWLWLIVFYVLLFTLRPGPVTDPTFWRLPAWVTPLSIVVSVGLHTLLFVNVQPELNRYWSALPNTVVERAPIGIGERLVIVLGAIYWVLLLLNPILQRWLEDM